MCDLAEGQAEYLSPPASSHFHLRPDESLQKQEMMFVNKDRGTASLRPTFSWSCPQSTQMTCGSNSCTDCCIPRIRVSQDRVSKDVEAEDNHFFESLRQVAAGDREGRTVLFLHKVV